MGLAFCIFQTLVNFCLGSFLYIPKHDKLRLLLFSLKVGSKVDETDANGTPEIEYAFYPVRSNLVWSWMINQSCMPCDTIDRLITSTSWYDHWHTQMQSLHKYARSTTRSTALSGTVSLFCMVAPPVSRLGCDGYGSVPLSNPTLSWKHFGIPKSIITIYFLGLGYYQWDGDAHHFPTWNRFE